MAINTYAQYSSDKESSLNVIQTFTVKMLCMLGGISNFSEGIGYLNHPYKLKTLKRYQPLFLQTETGT